MSIFNLPPNCLCNIPSCVHPKNAQGLLKSYQNSTFTSSPSAMPPLLHLGIKDPSPFEISPSESPFFPSFSAIITDSTKCIRSWPQYNLPSFLVPFRSHHTSSGTQNPGTPGDPRFTAQSVETSKSLLCLLPSKLPSSIACTTAFAPSIPALRTAVIKTVLSLTFFPSTQYARYKACVRAGRSFSSTKYRSLSAAVVF